MTASLLRDLRRLLGRAALSADPASTAAYSRDLWPLTNLRAFSGTLPRAPHVVCWPETAAQVSAIYRYASAQAVPIVPYGAGSGVCGGTVPLFGGITIDLKRLDRIEPANPAQRTVVAQAGVIGEHLERSLAPQGFTLGHFPSSIYCSTVGGYLATRSAGQLSTRYGKFEDMALASRVVLPDGELIEIDTSPDRPGQTPLMPLLIGSEGTLGSFIDGTMRIETRPAARSFIGLLMPDAAAGAATIQQLMVEGWRPAAIRLYDELDTLLAGVKTDPHAPPGLLTRLIERHRPVNNLLVHAFLKSYRLVNRYGPRLAPGALLVIGFEGNSAPVEAGIARVREIARAAGGRDLGPGPGEHWWRSRYAISYKASHIYTRGAMLDTMEVAAPWDRLMPLYHAVREAIAPHAMVLAHFSHAYPDGCSIYFSFTAAAGSRQQLERHYHAAWQAGLDATVRAGGTIAHHHGIGLLKAPWMRAEYGGAYALFEAAKQQLDPAGIANPGKLGLPVAAAAAAPEVRVARPDLGEFAERQAALCLKTAPDPDALRQLVDMARRMGVSLASGPSEMEDGAVRLPDRDPAPLRLRADSLLLEAPISLGSRDAADLLETAGLALLPHPWDLPQWPLNAVLAGEVPPLPGPFALAPEQIRGIEGFSLQDGRPFKIKPAPRRAAGPDFAAFFRGSGFCAHPATGIALGLSRREAHWSRWRELQTIDEGLSLLRQIAAGALPLVSGRLLVHPGESPWIQLVGDRETEPESDETARPDTSLASLFEWRDSGFGYHLPRVAWRAGLTEPLLRDPTALDGGGVLWLRDPWRAVLVVPGAGEPTPSTRGAALARALR